MLLRRAPNNLQKEGLAMALASKALNLSNKESAELRWKPGMQGRGSRGGRGDYSPRCISNDGSGGRKHPSEKENGVNQVLDKGVGLSSLPISQESSTSKSGG
ncbi:hypothetical protein RHGRI_030687 [Rhododendron griersonianum]|uniref:Uncharacterized protein n=1 Tax=Rhododendron griersonianum TaxID=479676 RepID=A0AAV6I5I2_9ERIC|nr:hypothetical protein RHGRI_030687 [Rhododendron griersonianum]